MSQTKGRPASLDHYSVFTPVNTSSQVRCDRSEPCKQCLLSRLPCSYQPISCDKYRSIQPKGNQDTIDSGSSSCDPLSTPSSPTFGSQGLLSPQVIEASVSAYFDSIYPISPVITRPWLQQRVVEVQTCIRSHCLVGALCAFSLGRCGVHQVVASRPLGPLGSDVFRSGFSNSIQETQQTGLRLAEDVQRTRQSFRYHRTKPNTATVATSYLLSAIYSDLGNHGKSDFYLQEATQFAKSIAIDQESSYSNLETTTSIQNRRLFWTLFIAER